MKKGYLCFGEFWRPSPEDSWGFVQLHSGKAVMHTVRLQFTVIQYGSLPQTIGVLRKNPWGWYAFNGVGRDSENFTKYEYFSHKNAIFHQCKVLFQEFAFSRGSHFPRPRRHTIQLDVRASALKDSLLPPPLANQLS